MSKRVSSLARAGMSAKKTKFNPTFMPTRIATAEVAAAVDADPPLPKLIQEVNSHLAEPEKGGCIAYWMRMGDLRSELFGRQFHFHSLTICHAQSPIIEHWQEHLRKPRTMASHWSCYLSSVKQNTSRTIEVPRELISCFAIWLPSR